MSDPILIKQYNDRYVAAMHGAQSATAFCINRGIGTTPSRGNDHEDTIRKHLRIGIDARAVEFGALAKLLMDKGFISEEEYYKTLAEAAERELDMQTQRVRDAGFTNVSFG